MALSQTDLSLFFSDAFTQQELDVINCARKLLKDKLRYETISWSGKMTATKKRTIIELLMLLGLEVWDEQIKAQIDGAVHYLVNVWGLKNAYK